MSLEQVYWDSSPSQLFKEVEYTDGSTHFVHRRNRKIAMVYTDGACINNGQPDATGGYAAAVSRSHIETGPLDYYTTHTSQRAELEAVLAGLRAVSWPNKFNKLVVATDSMYVVKGATDWMNKWRANNWNNSRG